MSGVEEIVAFVIVAYEYMEVAKEVVDTINGLLDGVEKLFGRTMTPNGNPALRRQLLQMEANIKAEIRAVQLEDKLAEFDQVRQFWYGTAVLRIPDGPITRADFDDTTGTLKTVADALLSNIGIVLGAIRFFTFHRISHHREYLRLIIDAYTLALSMAIADEAFQTVKGGRLSKSFISIPNLAMEAVTFLDEWCVAYRAQRLTLLGTGRHVFIDDNGEEVNPPHGGHGPGGPGENPPLSSPPHEHRTLFRFFDKGADDIIGRIFEFDVERFIPPTAHIGGDGASFFALTTAWTESETGKLVKVVSSQWTEIQTKALSVLKHHGVAV